MDSVFHWTSHCLQDNFQHLIIETVIFGSFWQWCKPKCNPGTILFRWLFFLTVNDRWRQSINMFRCHHYSNTNSIHDVTLDNDNKLLTFEPPFTPSSFSLSSTVGGSVHSQQFPNVDVKQIDDCSSEVYFVHIMYYHLYSFFPWNFNNSIHQQQTKSNLSCMEGTITLQSKRKHASSAW
jgi:hypothetical protein